MSDNAYTTRYDADQDEPERFVTATLAITAARVTPNTFRQWLFRQWHPKPNARTRAWFIAVASDVHTRELVYSLPDVMRAEAATRRSAMTRTVRDDRESIA